MLKSWIRGVFGRKPLTIVNRPRRAGLGLEQLDDRLAPAVLTVNSILDTSSDSDGFLTLRKAIEIVNSPTQSGTLSAGIQAQISGTLHGGGADMIVFDAGLAGQTIYKSSGEYALTVSSATSQVAINAPPLGITIDGGFAGRVFNIAGGVEATFSGLNIFHGDAGAPFSGPGGGGILNAGTLTVIKGEIGGNYTDGDMGTSGGGGGIANTGTLTVIDSTFTGNYAGSMAAGGSAIYSSGTATIVGSTFRYNGSTGGASGGAIAVGGGQVSVLNSTFSGNAGRYGSAVYVDHGMVTVVNSTFAENEDGGSGGNGVIYVLESATVLNSVFSANTAGGGPGTAVNVSNGGFGTVVTANNVDSSTAILGPLTNNGGPTETHVPLAGSAVFGAGVAPTTLSVQIPDGSETTITVADASRLVLIPDYSVILVDSEQMLVTGVSGNTLTVVRGYNGTTADFHNPGEGVFPAFDQRGEPRLTGGQLDAGSVQYAPFNVTSPAAATTVNAATVTVEGNAQADSLVQIYVDVNGNGVIDSGTDTVVASEQLTGGATTYSVTVPLTRNAVNKFLATATPPMGIESAPEVVPTITEDSTAPNTPSVTAPASAVTLNAASYTITGTAEADSLVTVYRDVNGNGVLDGGDTVVDTQQLTGGATSYSISASLTQDAVNKFLVTSTDAAGNESTAAVVPFVTEDSIAPGAPSVMTPIVATTVNAPSALVSGLTQTGNLVKVYRDANGNGVVDAGDTVVGSQQVTNMLPVYSIPVPLTQDAVNKFLVTATDAAGNESTAAVVPFITEDSTAPNAPVVASPNAAATVNAATTTVTGTAELNSLVQVYRDANGNGVLDAGDAVVGSQQLAGGSGSFSISVPLAQDAVNKFLVTSKDVAANESVAAVVAFVTEDSTAPAAPGVTAPAAAVTVNAATYSVGFTAEAESLVKIYRDANGNGVVDAGDTVVGSQQFTGIVTAFAIDVPLTQDAVNKFLVTATDAAGNESTAAVVPFITEDSIAPNTPTVSAPNAATTVNAATTTVAGTAEADSLVTVYRDTNNNGIFDGGDTVVGSQQLAGGATGYSVTVPLTQDAVNRFLVTSADAAGNVSSAVVAPVVVEDSTAPAAPVVSTPAVAQVVDAAGITITGTAEGGSTVRVYFDTNNNGVVDAGDVIAGTRQAAGDGGAYSIVVPLNQDAVNRFLVTSTDVAGNTSVATVVPVVIEDSSAPAAPSVTGPAVAVSTGADTYTLTGTSEAGSVVKVYADTNGNGVIDAGEPVVGTQQLAPGATAYSITVPLAGDAVNRFLVTATDNVGKVSTAAVVSNILQGEPDAGVPLAFAAGADVGGGTAQLFNPDGTVRLSVNPFPDSTGGVRVATADVTGDRIPDLLVGTGPGTTNQVKVYDGATGAVLFQATPFGTFTGGVYVEAADLDGDGKAELVVTPDQGGGPRVQVIDGATGRVRADFFGIDDPDFRGGARVAAADMNNDGVPDLIVGAGFGGGPRVAAYDGKALTGGTIKKLFSDIFVFGDALRNGVYLTSGDIDGDGYADLIAGGGPGGGPRVYALSGKALVEDGVEVPLANFFGGDPTNRNGIRVATADLDLDGKADVIVGSGQSTGSRVTVYLGKDIRATGTPPATNDFDAFANLGGSNLFAGGVFVG